MSAENQNNAETVLIAEDSPPNRKILGHLLKELGFNVISCENGEEAWNKLNDPATGHVDCIISDIMMPKMDGLELLKNVRGLKKTRALPFVLVTSIKDEAYKTQAQSLNVNGYILKPVTFQRVTAQLQELFPAKSFPKLAA